MIRRLSLQQYLQVVKLCCHFIIFLSASRVLSQQSSHKYRGPFFLSPSLVYKDTNLRNYGDPAHNKERNLMTTFHNVEEVAVQQRLRCRDWNRIQSWKYAPCDLLTSNLYNVTDFGLTLCRRAHWLLLLYFFLFIYVAALLICSWPLSFSGHFIFFLVRNRQLSRPAVSYAAWLFFQDGVTNPKRVTWIDLQNLIFAPSHVFFTWLIQRKYN